MEGSGKFLLDEAWMGKPINPHREKTWPRQGKPTSSDWATWRSYLSKGLLHRGRRLKQPLGEWKCTSDNPWCYCPTEGTLYHSSSSGYRSFSCIPRVSGRIKFSNAGTIVTPPDTATLCDRLLPRTTPHLDGSWPM
jgi:hypothetical protein